MKKILYILTTLSALAVLFSCSPERLEETAGSNGRAMVFTAYTVPDVPATKTELHDGGPEVWWSVGDAINVFQGSVNARFVSTNREPVRQAEFQGYLPAVTGTSASFWAIYPYAADNSVDGQGIKGRVPASQTAQGGTFDPSALLTVAHTDNLTLAFQNVCGGLKFQVTQDWIQQVEFRSNDDTPLAGKVSVLWDNSDHPAVMDIEEASNAVRLTAPYGETFKPGTWYYLTCLPALLKNGFTLVFRSETQTGVKVYSGEREIERSTWGRLSAADSGVVPEEEHNGLYDNVISYTTTDEQVFYPQNEYDFGATIVSNIYQNGRGAIIFDAPLRRIASNSFAEWDEVDRLSSVRLPWTVEEIGAYAFGSCMELTEVCLPSSLTKLEERAFSWCSKLGTLELPDGLMSIGDGVFEGMSQLSEITIPESVQEIGVRAFYGCENLVAFGGPLTTEDKRGVVIDGTLVAFAQGGLESPVDYVIEAGVRGLAERVFENVWQFRDVTLPSSLEQIGEGAFSNCGQIRAFYGPFSSKDGRFLIQDSTLKAVAFANAAYESFELPEGITRIGGFVYYLRWDVTSVVIPEGIVEIGNSAFDCCWNLTDVSLPSTLRVIGSEAFSNCQGESFTEFTIPAGVTTVGGAILNGSINLKKITVLPETPPSFPDGYWQPLGGGFDNATIFVPAASLEAYQTTYGWNNQSNYQAISE